MRLLITLLLIIIHGVAMAQEPLRESYTLNDDWRFFFSDERDSDTADFISLPHSWNSDSEARRGSYLRTTANYMRQIYIPAEWSNKRLFLRFGGVQSVADLFVNGRHIGEHRGGYTAFTMEITHRVNFGANNMILVVVSNNQRNDVLPTSTDQMLYGGIYRDVELLVTNKQIVSPTYYSSDGVFVDQHEVSPERASGVVRLYASAPGVEHLTVNMRIVGPDGYEVVRRAVRVSKLDPAKSIDIPYEIESPVLWSPDEPNLYTVEVSLGNPSALTDRVVVTTGLRKITISDDNRLCINGSAVDVRGVNYAHDRRGKGAILGREELLEDLATMADMGVTAVRSLGGPHVAELYDECDRRGLLAWVDIPFTRASYALADVCYYPTTALRENGFEQLREVIAQSYNHPSVVMWGLFSETWQRGDDVTGYIGELNDLAHSLDSSRKTVGCSDADGAINLITDLIVFRQSVGWSKGHPSDVAVWCSQLGGNKMWSRLRYGVCYGEEGSRSQQVDELKRAERGSLSLPERRHTELHECYSEILASSQMFWGLWLNNMFDYASARRAYGLNQSGVVEFDHRTKKDAYYLYRAMWNGEVPTLYITERRWVERRDTLHRVTVYASEGSPTLLVDGDTVPLRRAGAGRWVADTVVVHDRAELVAIDTLQRLRDTASIRVGNLKARRAPRGLRTL